MLKDLTADQILTLAFIGAHIDGIAHNINTPLTAIMGRRELLQLRLEKLRDPAASPSEAELEKCFNDLAIISQCCEKIDEVLKNSVHTGAGILRPQTHWVHLDQVLKSVLAFLNADMEFKHQTTKTIDFQENIPPVKADQLAFPLAFLEILYNARSAMLEAPEKKLHILMSAAEGFVSIAFRDSGCGMAEARRLEMLELMGSAQEIRGRESGLPRVARLLRPYGVTYDIQSRAGETVFSLHVPVMT